MAVILETIIAGGLIWQRKIGRKAIRKGESKAPKINPTPFEVEKINARYSERTLQIKLHHNFCANDHHIILTYQGEEPTRQQAKEDLKKFKRNMRREYKKNGLPFKWIAVTEYENKRIHHHMVINQGLQVSEIRELWGNGTIHERPLSKSGDWRKLGEYLIKETSKTFRDDDGEGKTRYSCSRNLSMPEIYREEITVSELLEEPKPIKGYYIDADSMYKGVNPVTERPYVEYVMLPIHPCKIKKRFNKKQKMKYKQENYNAWLKQNMPRQYRMDFAQAFKKAYL